MDGTTINTFNKGMNFTITPYKISYKDANNSVELVAFRLLENLTNEVRHETPFIFHNGIHPKL